ncbi:protease htpX [Candidatus Omnitrophus magneticus]|uniref:Protease HtpX homolog n=1 Tax=Candidatus Omnitrophus magneticus TaxID=1609969 RepID=A0A0F0CRI3_9BACT|nr:protease htpX [Candidatus Omnitrophus magneticus]
MFILKMKMYLLLGILFAIIYAIITAIGAYMGISNFYFYLIVSLAMMYIQYLIGPKIVEWSMKVKYIGEGEYPYLHSMVEELAKKANLPKPKIGISPVAVPNAFAFGRGHKDGRICVTEGILNLLDRDELKAVLGHEMAHIKNRDVLTITLLSVIPMILYRVAWHFMWYGGGNRRRGEGQNTVMIGLLAFLFYFITNLLVLYGSRIREYFADKGSVELGNKPSALASALYKLVYGSARMNKEAIKEVEGLKAFFVNDPSQALHEIRELSQLDMDKSGSIDMCELENLKNKEIKLNFGDKMMEVLSTHPNMLKRIKQLSTY